MCFHSVAHITAISSFYEVPGELKKKKAHTQTQSKLEQISAIQSLFFMLKTKNRWYFPCCLSLVIEHLCG